MFLTVQTTWIQVTSGPAISAPALAARRPRATHDTFDTGNEPFPRGKQKHNAMMIRTSAAWVDCSAPLLGPEIPGPRATQRPVATWHMHLRIPSGCAFS